MFLARIVGTQTQVYPLIVPLEPRAWTFWSYRGGASAIAETELQAIVAARRELARKAINKLYVRRTHEEAMQA